MVVLCKISSKINASIQIRMFFFCKTSNSYDVERTIFIRNCNNRVKIAKKVSLTSF